MGVQQTSSVRRLLHWTLLAVAWRLAFQGVGSVEGSLFQEQPFLEEEYVPIEKNEAYFAECTLKQVENICSQNITMAREDGSRVKAPGVSIWIQAHCGNEKDEEKRSKCALQYIADDFGDDQADEFFGCVCQECPRACKRNGNLRNRQNVKAKETFTATSSSSSLSSQPLQSSFAGTAGAY